MTNTEHLPTETLPVIAITIVNTGGAGYLVRDTGGAFVAASFPNPHQADDEAMTRMNHYCALGHAVLPWSVPG